MQKFALLFLMVLLAKTAPASSMDFDQIAAIVSSPGGPRTVEDFLQVLQKKDADLFSHFTLMRLSQSRQEASPQFPRAIAFGKDARFILTFNGDATQAGFNNIEMMSFVENQSEAHFELRELRFDPNGLKTPELSPTNPPLCMRCHGTEPKPIWEQYDKWPGAYGEVDDAIIDFDDHQRYPPTGYDDSENVARNRQQLKEFRAFVATKDAHTRYQKLIFPTGTTSPVAPYIPTVRNGSEPLRPNLQLSHKIAVLQGIKLASSISRLGQTCSEVGAPLAVALLLQCDDYNIQNADLKKIDQELRTDAAQDPLPAALRPMQWSMINNENYFSGLVRLVNLMGLSDYEWSSARIKRQWSYFQGFKDGSDDLIAALWPQFIKQGLALPNYNAVRAELYPGYSSSDYLTSTSSPEIDARVDARQQACQGLLRNASHFSVQRFKVDCKEDRARSVETPSEIEVPKTAQMCQSCHSGTGPGPKIDLKSPSMSEKIWQRIHSTEAGKRMPPDRPLTIREYEELKKFIH